MDGSEPWKRSLIEAVLKPNIGTANAVLEIGLGAGRWSAELLQLAQRVTLMDVSSRCIEECRARFGRAPNVEYAVNEGRTIPFENERFDRIWSFDVFVHIRRDDIASYLSGIFRVLVRGGKAVIHHTADGGIRGHWRSSMTKEDFAALAGEAGLTLVDQFDSWEFEGTEYEVRGSGDAITIVEKQT